MAAWDCRKFSEPPPTITRGRLHNRQPASMPVHVLRVRFQDGLIASSQYAQPLSRLPRNILIALDGKDSAAHVTARLRVGAVPSGAVLTEEVRLIVMGAQHTHCTER